jgi:hypothetical protein
MMLTTPDTSIDAMDWVFGWWNATTISVKGWWRLHGDFASGKETPATAKPLELCIASQTVLDLAPGGAQLSVDGDDAFERLSEIRSDSYLLATRSQLAESLSGEMRSCLAETGYSLDRGDRDGRPSLSAALDDDWSYEEQLRAVLASATCNDRIGLTEQLAGLMAAYQERSIAEHEGELNAIRGEAERRLQLAHALLREVGLE